MGKGILGGEAGSRPSAQRLRFGWCFQLKQALLGFPQIKVIFNIELAPEVYADLNHQAELALARLSGLLPMMPRFTIERVRQTLETTVPTATAVVKVLEDLDIVTEMTGQKKNRCYSYQPYIELLSR